MTRFSDSRASVPGTHAAPVTPPRRQGDAELLATALGLGDGPQAMEHCRRAIGACDGLRGLFEHAANAPRPAREGLTEGQHAQLAAMPELLRRLLEERLRRGDALTSPAETLAYLRATLHNRRREVFCCLLLDTRHRVIECEELFQGSIDGACVYPRVVAERALRAGAAAVIIAHNHPSGVSEPSLADQAITRRLKEALALLEIRLLDHFVIGDGEPVSLASRGLL